MVEEFLKLRKKVLEEDYIGLNESQKEAVFASGTLLVLAGAGSGKTHVIINRIINLIKNGDAGLIDLKNIGSDVLSKLPKQELTELRNNSGVLSKYLKIIPVNPKNILAITFTNKAAKEIKNRLYEALGGISSQITASTFHSLCLKILRKEIVKLNSGYDSNFVVFDQADQKVVVKECIQELKLKEDFYNLRVVLNSISQAKNKFINFLNKLQKDLGIFDHKLIDIYSLYEKKLKSYNAFDFDDLIVKTVELFKKDAEVLEYYQDLYRYIMVDEFQDTNYAQCKLVSMLFKKHKNLCAVGDDDQSIYKFRGANIKNILDFENLFGGAKVIKLEENFRSTKNILNAANEIIKNNTSRKGKQLWTNNHEGAKIKILALENEYAEAEFVSQEIKKMIDELEKNENDFAVLYRNNSLSRKIENSFSKHGINYKVYGGLKFYDRKEIKDLIAYIRLVYNVCDDVSLKRIINFPRRGIGKTSIDKISSIAEEKNICMYNVCKNIKKIENSFRNASKIENFVFMIEEFVEKSKEANFNLEEFVKLVLDRTAILSEFENSDSVEDRAKSENLQEFIIMINENIKNNSCITLSDFLENISISGDLENFEDSESFVKLMSLHSAKGLEFDVVFLIGFEESIFPSFRSIGDEEEIEEERRLCYVGVTRAKKNLYITRSKSRSSFIRTIDGKSKIKNASNKKSRFIDEIPENLIENLDYSNQADEINFSKEKAVHQERSNYDSDLEHIKRTIKNIKKEKIASKLEFMVGDVIKHVEFGTGIIVSIDSLKNDYKIQIMFDGFSKKFMLSAAKIEKFKQA